MENATVTKDPGRHARHSEKNDEFQSNLTLYVGVSIGIGVAIVLCIVVIVMLRLYKKGKFRGSGSRRESLRRLFVRGFSTVSQRGVIDSTAEFEMINTSATASVSSECSARCPDAGKGPPKKPERRRTRTSSSNAAKYENVTLDPKAGFVVRKSASMASNIPFIDGTLEGRIKEDDDDDDVFE